MYWLLGIVFDNFNNQSGKLKKFRKKWKIFQNWNTALWIHVWIDYIVALKCTAQKSDSFSQKFVSTAEFLMKPN